MSINRTRQSVGIDFVIVVMFNASITTLTAALFQIAQKRHRKSQNRSVVRKRYKMSLM